MIAIAHRFAKNAYFMFPVHSVHVRSKVMAPNESPYMISFMSTIQMETLSLIVFVKSADFTIEL